MAQKWGRHEGGTRNETLSHSASPLPCVRIYMQVRRFNQISADDQRDPPPPSDEAGGGRRQRESGEYILLTEYLSHVEPLSSRRDVHTILPIHKQHVGVRSGPATNCIVPARRNVPAQKCALMSITTRQEWWVDPSVPFFSVKSWTCPAHCCKKSTPRNGNLFAAIGFNYARWWWLHNIAPLTHCGGKWQPTERAERYAENKTGH